MRRFDTKNPTEKAIHSAVIDHWRLLGRPMTLVATLANEGAMGQPGLTPGLPDLLVMGPDVPNTIAFMELKRRQKRAKAKPGNRLTETEEAQAAFAMLCARLGLHCPTVYGRDEPITYLERWNVVRRQRYPEPPGFDRRLELDWPA